MNMSKKVSLSILSLSVLATFTQSACANPNPANNWNAQGDMYFNDAERASRSGGDMYQYQQQMAGSNLEMYPEYWQLNQYLSSQQPNTIINFVNRYQGSVMAEKLVADYAEEKARQGDYASVRAVANYITNADASEACAIALGFSQGGDSMRAFVEKNKVWLDTTKKQPELCLRLASEMNNNVMISNDDRSQRLYRMIRIGNNSEIVPLASRLGVALDYMQLANVGNNPNAFLANIGSLSPTPANRLLYLVALARMTDKSVNEAGMQLQYDLQRSPQFFDERTKRYAYRTLGVARMNVNTDIGFNVEAVDWFKNSLGEPFNFEEAEDYAQASIRFSRWADLANAIGAMDYKTQQEPIWQYWLAKAYNHAGNAQQKQQARQMFTNLSQKNDYYGLLSKDQLGQRFNQMPTAKQPTNSDYNRLAQDPHFSRAFSLYNMSADRAYANREWNWAVRKASERGDNAMILAAAQRANDMGWHDRAIFAIETTRSLPNVALAYPMPYQSAVVSYSQRFGIDPAWVYGIIRQESRFQASAKSGVGAGGLMQVMPNTAKEIARKLGEPYNASNITHGDTNIRYGTFYLSDIFGQLSSNPALATAGYNAGASKARRWQPDFGSLPADQYVESIPYPETRGYVKAVMENTANYGVLLGEQQSISQRMGTIYSK
nr:transglycosylase SLT domain-containing protein [uncultured Moraxella sp.]